MLKDFPGLTQEELDWVESLFPATILFAPEGKRRRVWTSCCHREELLRENETQNLHDLRSTRHGGATACPWCGRTVSVYARNKFKNARMHDVYIPVVFFRASEDGEDVWAQAYWAKRELLRNPCDPILYMPTMCYYFTDGAALEWEVIWDAVCQNSVKTGFMNEPFRKRGLYSPVAPYLIHGKDELNRSFLRYTGWETPLIRGENENERESLMRYLGVAAKYPKQVEMLRKAGMDEVLVDWVYAKKKNADVIRWGERDPRKAFRLTKQELKAFLETDRTMDTLRLYKKMDKQMSFEWCNTAGKTLQYIVDRMRKRRGGTPWKKLIGYLEKQSEGVGTLNRTVIMWLDYLDESEELGYDLENPLIRMPGYLEKKYDEIMSKYQIMTDQIIKEEAKKRYNDLNERYGWEEDGYLIRPPLCAEEIVAEGKALRHCVGGYAKRHSEGSVTILFMRKTEISNIPYVTIEMNGKRIVQIHGYKNDQGAKSPSETHKELLDRWTAWLMAGSKRDKQGNPKMRKEA